MCMSQRGVRSGGGRVTHPNHGSPIFPLPPCCAAHELWVSGHGHGYKDHQLQERAAAFPVLARWASRDRAVSSSIVFADKVHAVPQLSQKPSEAAPQPPRSLQASSTSHTMSCIEHQQLREVSWNSSDADHVSSKPLRLPADGCPKSLFALPKVGNETAWRTWCRKKCENMVDNTVFTGGTTLLPEEFLKDKSLHSSLALDLALQQLFPYFTCFILEAVIPW